MDPVPLVSGRQLAALVKSSGVRDGDRVAVAVVRALGGDRYVVRLRGQTLPTRSTVLLSPGQVFPATVSMQSGTVLLRLNTPAHGADGLAIPADRAVAANLQAVGLPVQPSLLSALRRFHDPSDARSSTRVRLAALLLDKGIDASPELLSDLETIVLGDHRTRDGGRRGREEKQRRRRPTVPPLTDESDEADHPVQLFNHFEGKRGQWILLPISTYQGLAGSLQLFYPYSRASYQRSILTVRSETTYWAFVWDNPKTDGGATVRVFTDEDGSSLARPLDDLRSALAPFGLDVEDVVASEPISASFARFESEAIMGGVDRVV